MGEGREYISRPDEMGNIHIAEDVLAVMAAAAALEVEGVGSLAANLGNDIVEMLGGKKNLAKGVRVSTNEDGSLTVDIAIRVQYGFVIPDVAKAVQEAVRQCECLRRHLREGRQAFLTAAPAGPVDDEAEKH